MAYKIILTQRVSKKLTKMFVYLEKTFSLEVAKELVEKIDRKMNMVGLYPGAGLSSSRIPGVYKISIGIYNKLYYRVTGKRIVILDLLDTGNKSVE